MQGSSWINKTKKKISFASFGRKESWSGFLDLFLTWWLCSFKLLCRRVEKKKKLTFFCCDGDLNLQPPWLQRSPLDSIQICGIGRRFLWVNQHLKSENHGIVTAPEKNTHTHVHKQEHTHQNTKQLSQLRTQRRRLKRIQSLQIVTFCNSEHKKVIQVLTFKALEKCSAKRNNPFYSKVDTVQIWKYNGITLVLKTSKHFWLLAVLFDHYFKKLWGCV